MSECFFWYRLTRVDLNKGPLNGLMLLSYVNMYTLHSDSQLPDPFSNYRVTNSSLISRILRNFDQVALYFATLNVGDISHHTFNIHAL